MLCILKATFINILEPSLEPLHHGYVTFSVHILLMSEGYLSLIEVHYKLYHKMFHTNDLHKRLLISLLFEQAAFFCNLNMQQQACFSTSRVCIRMMHSPGFWGLVGHCYLGDFLQVLWVFCLKRIVSLCIN